jgi:hypothetical protein
MLRLELLDRPFRWLGAISSHLCCSHGAHRSHRASWKYACVLSRMISALCRFPSFYTCQMSRGSQCEFTIGKVETSFFDNFLVRTAESTGGDDGSRDRLPGSNQSRSLSIYRVRASMGTRRNKHSSLVVRAQRFVSGQLVWVTDYCR